MSLTLLRATADWAAFDKPSGMAVHRGWADDDAPTALACARDLLGARVYPVHRLDRATSGVLLFARHPGAAAALQAHFAQGLAEKTYLALVRGTPPAQGRIDHPLPRSKERTDLADRVAAVTDFETLGSARDEVLGRSFSLVLCRPRTGRQHQIRRHLKHIAHPLVGDVNYGKGDINRHFRTAYGLGRTALHALRLALPDGGAGGPAPGPAVAFTAPLPADFAGALEMLGLSGVYASALSTLPPGVHPCAAPDSPPAPPPSP